MAKAPETLDIWLVSEVKRACESQQIHLDTFDADFIVGSMMLWLDRHAAALTGSGVRPLADL